MRCKGFIILLTSSTWLLNCCAAHCAHALALWHRQVGPNLYSCSLSEEDLDNFFAHSCEPCLRGTILPDYTIELFAARDIAAGESLTIDYEKFEEDLVSKGVDFECKCGAPSCRCVCLMLCCVPVGMEFVG